MVLISGVLTVPAFAGAPSGCLDLEGIPPQPAVDFESRIQPLFSGCTGCHGIGAVAGLDLRPGEAYANLVGVESTSNSPQLRVQPFEPEQSVLFNAVNCSSPGGPGAQMGNYDPDDRALIRDWIAQGALARPAARPVPAVNSPGSAILISLMLLVLLSTRSGITRRSI